MSLNKKRKRQLVKLLVQLTVEKAKLTYLSSHQKYYVVQDDQIAWRDNKWQQYYQQHIEQAKWRANWLYTKYQID